MNRKKKLPIILWVFIGIFSCAAALGLASYFSLKSAFKTTKTEPGLPIKPSGLFGKTDFVGVLNIEGPIFDASEIFESLDDIEKSEGIKALLVRINSPGGAVPPTQEIFNRLLALREKMPVVCSLADVAASGGYYIAAACEEIFTNPGTLTGSIGVIMQLMNVKELYSWAKIKPITMKAGKFKDSASPFRDMSEEEKELLQAILDETHAQFKADITKGRGTEQAALEQYADGRVFLGSQAVAYGFADSIGGKKEALAKLKENAELDENARIVEWPKKKETFRRFFETQVETLVKSFSLKNQVANPELRSGIPYFLPSHMIEGL